MSPDDLDALLGEVQQLEAEAVVLRAEVAGGAAVLAPRLSLCEATVSLLRGVAGRWEAGRQLSVIVLALLVLPLGLVSLNDDAEAVGDAVRAVVVDELADAVARAVVLD